MNKARRRGELRHKCKKFRILIIGRENAGKSTILKRICDTTEEPEIYDADGSKVDLSVLTPSQERGEDDIYNDMVFQSNPGFVFHDSRGFEAGGIEELEKVKEFIVECAKALDLKDHLHAIWYCIPLDNSSPFTTAERQFFSECDTGSVPVIAIFTKFDALVRNAFEDLKQANYSWEEAMAEAPNRATADFDRIYPDLVYNTKYPAKAHVCLQKMNQPEADCSVLITKTADALDSEVLQQLFVSTQRNNLALWKRYAIKKTVIPEMAKGIASLAVSKAA